MQPKKPRFNPLVIAIVLAAVLMVWSVLGGTGGNANGSSMAYSTVVHYFESNQVTKFSLDLNTGVITMTLKEGAQELPNAAEQTTTQSTGGLLSGLLSSSSSAPTGVKKNDDGTETVSYKLPYARMFVDHVSDYIAQYDAANPDAPMVYDYVPAKETIPWMEIIFYLDAGLHRLFAVLDDAGRRRWWRRHHECRQSQGQGRAREQEDRHLCRCGR